MINLKSRIVKIEQSLGKHRKLTDDDYRNGREHVWAGTLPDHPQLTDFVKEMRKDVLTWYRWTPDATFTIDVENARIADGGGQLLENLTDDEIARVMAPISEWEF